MVDTGGGRQVVMLEHVDYPDSYHIRGKGGEVAIPFRMGELEFVYTSLRQARVTQYKYFAFSPLQKGRGGENSTRCSLSGRSA